MRTCIGCLLFLLLGCSSSADDAAGGEDATSSESGAGGGASAKPDGGTSGSAKNTGGGRATGSTANAGGATSAGGATGTGGGATGGTNHPEAGAAGAARPDGGSIPNCSSLASSPGWTHITPPETDSPVFTAALAVDPFQTGALWISARNNRLFRSTDCGSTWTHVSTGRNSSKLEGGGTGGVAGMAVDPVDRGVMYVASYMSPTNIWKSTNGGVDWDPLIADGTEVANVVQYIWFQSVSLDPTDHLHLVAATHAGCAAPYNDGCQVETFDGGATWKIAKNPNGMGWQENGGSLAFGPTTWIYGCPFGQLWLTTDHGASWKDATPPGGHGTSGGFSSLTSRASDGYYYLPTLWNMMRSTDALTWEALPGLTGRFVGMVTGNGYLFAADQWSATFNMAKLSDLSKWTSLGVPPGQPSDQGSPFMAYDEVNRVLYASTYAGGLWRIVAP